VNVATTLVGDRTQVRGLALAGGQVWLDLVEQGPSDAACCPTQLARRAWALHGDELTATDVEGLGTLALAVVKGEWVLTHLAIDEPLPPGPEVTLSIERGEIQGSGGCNRFFGSITEASPGQVEIGPVGSTRKACPEDEMRRETTYLRRLEATRQYGFLAGRLALTWQSDDEMGVLLFERRR
jgi:heat shock protein HslJ